MVPGKGKLQSSWISPETGTSPAPIEITAFIRQNFTTVSVEMRTDQMVSRSYIVGFKKDADSGTCELCYTYTSQAFADSVSSNPWHDGTAKLAINDRKEIKLKGDYWTLRKTIGTMELQRISNTIDV